MKVPDPVAYWAGSEPARPAVRWAGGVLSYGELDRRQRATACRLAGLGVTKGARVALLLRNGVPFVVLVGALARLGAVCVPLHVRLAGPELRWRLEDCAPQLLLTEPELQDLAAEAGWKQTVCVDPEHPELLPDARPEPVRLQDRYPGAAVQGILYTSATTGEPKGAQLTFANHFWNALYSNLHLGCGPEGGWLVVLPLYHVGGLAVLWRAALSGSVVVLHDRFDPDAFNHEVDLGVAYTSLVPTMLDRVLQSRAARPVPASLRAVLLGGGPVPAELVVQAARRGWPVAPTYGLTEAASQVATLHPAVALYRPDSAGRPLLGVEVRAGRSAQEPGEILVRGPTVMKGYFRRPEATARTLRGGWLHTGDVGYVDPEGHLHVLDRREDLIVTGGENVYPAEVEAVLRAHPAVAEAAVVGLPDPQWGQQVVGFVRVRPGMVADPQELVTFCRARLAGFKVPRRVWIIDRLPRAGLDKVSRRRLRELAAQLLAEGRACGKPW
ncbi:MAG: o-succinylbenzoate--CoA ligase [Armatimonadota bacterium]|nr:o-succinylbenzoate--CoA ligase [Armatimonadota bacterium]